MNTIRTLILMGFLAALMVAVGAVLGGRDGMMTALFFALITNFGAYWFSDRLAISMSGCRPVSRAEAPEYYEIVEELCQQAQLPLPTLYIEPKESPNAFATGRDPEHAAVSVTVGLLRLMNRSELKAVLAHELGHVKNRDILITSIASVMAAVITSIAHYGYYYASSPDDRDSANPLAAMMMMILAPIGATLVNLAISRSREFEADRIGAEICGHPEALVSALAKLEQGTQLIPMGVNPALGNLYTVKPDRGSWLSNLLSSHPPIPERIERLEEMRLNGRSGY